MKKRFLDKCKQIPVSTAEKLAKLQMYREDLHFISNQSNKTWDVMPVYHDRTPSKMMYIHIQKRDYPPHRFEYFAYRTKKGILIKQIDRRFLKANYFLYG